jgi:hypothetical protein
MATNPEPHVSSLVTRILHLPMTCDAEAFGMTAQVTDRIVVAIESPAPEHRSRLADFIVGCIETDLDARGAAPAAWGRDASLEAKIDDQLYRARLLGAGGLALRFSELQRVADSSGQLCEADSGALRRLLAIAEHERLQIFLPETTAALRVVGAPEPLSDWLTAASRDGRVAAIEYEPLDLPDDAGVAAQDAAAQDAAALLSAPSIDAFSEGSGPHSAPEGESASSGEQASLNESVRDTNPTTSERAAGADAATEAEPAPFSSELEAPASASAEPLDAESRERCVAWTGQLRNMNGPKLHAAVERAFVGAYLPLSKEAASGRVPPEARSALQFWAEGFAQSYAAAFKTFGLRTKRPRMVRDVIELGMAWLNQLRARQCQLLVVEAMRFDLGQLVNQLLERRLSGRAEFAEQAVLWAALPSNAESQQLGLTSVSRRAALERKRREPAETATPRIENLRVGSREIFRLDVIGADLGQPGERENERLARLAALIADIVAPWVQAQPPDTLVVLFGDHGFHWQTSQHATSPAQRGGALPEQVLVPASGWLLAPAAPKRRFGANLH